MTELNLEPLPYEILGHLRDEFSLSDIPYKVDVIDWATMTPEFKKIVLENCFDIQTTINH